MQKTSKENNVINVSILNDGVTVEKIIHTAKPTGDYLNHIFENSNATIYLITANVNDIQKIILTNMETIIDMTETIEIHFMQFKTEKINEYNDEINKILNDYIFI